jgi:hypothetical protein
LLAVAAALLHAEECATDRTPRASAPIAPTALGGGKCAGGVVKKKEAEREEGETCVVRIYIRLVRACRGVEWWRCSVAEVACPIGSWNSLHRHQLGSS